MLNVYIHLVFTDSLVSNFLLQIIGFTIAVIFFALMHQAHAWELDLPLPSMLTAVETNMRMPQAFLLLVVAPLLLSLILSLLIAKPLPPFPGFFIISIICYSFANGFVIILILSSQLVFYGAATVQVFIKLRSVKVYSSKVIFDESD